MTREQLEYLLNEALELLMSYEQSADCTEEDAQRIEAIFDAIKWSELENKHKNLNNEQ